MGEYIGIYVDVISYMGKVYVSQFIEIMLFFIFYMFGFCLDFFYKGFQVFIEFDEIVVVCVFCGQEIKKGDIFFFYIDYYWCVFGMLGLG